MIDVSKKKPSNQPISLSKILGKSTILALILTVPSLSIFLGIYYSYGNLLVAAIVGFGIHFVTLAFAGKISRFLAERWNED